MILLAATFPSIVFLMLMLVAGFLFKRITRLPILQPLKLTLLTTATLPPVRSNSRFSPIIPVFLVLIALILAATPVIAYLHLSNRPILLYALLTIFLALSLIAYATDTDTDTDTDTSSVADNNSSSVEAPAPIDQAETKL